MDREQENAAIRKELPSIQLGDADYIKGIYEKIATPELQLQFNMKLELLREAAETYLNPKSNELKGNTAIFFTRYIKGLDTLLRKANVETTKKQNPHDIGPIATRIGNIYQDLVGFQPKSVFSADVFKKA